MRWLDNRTQEDTGLARRILCGSKTLLGKVLEEMKQVGRRNQVGRSEISPRLGSIFQQCSCHIALYPRMTPTSLEDTSVARTSGCTGNSGREGTAFGLTCLDLGNRMAERTPEDELCVRGSGIRKDTLSDCMIQQGNSILHHMG